MSTPDPSAATSEVGEGAVARRVRLVSLRNTPLSVDELLDAVSDPTAGGQALFVGTVRDHDGGREVDSLSYTAHPTASVVLWEVALRTAGATDVVAVAAAHRLGHLEVGEVAVVVAVSAAHRAEALGACQRLIDDLKAEVPIWKHQRFADGTSEWVGIATGAGEVAGTAEGAGAPTLVP